MEHIKAKDGRIYYINMDEMQYMIEDPLKSSMECFFKNGKQVVVNYDVLAKESPDAADIKSPLSSDKK